MYVHSGIFFSRKKEKELPPFVATWVGLGVIKRHKMSEDRRPVTSHRQMPCDLTQTPCDLTETACDVTQMPCDLIQTDAL